MSTKTTIKRIALVAAVAAAFGGLSTVAANAATAINGTPVWSVTSAYTGVTAGGVTSSAGTQVVGGIATVTLSETTTAATAGVVASVTSSGVGSISSVTQASSPVLTPVLTGAGAVTQVATYPTSGFSVWGGSAGATNEALTLSLTSATAGTQTLSVTPIGANGVPGTAVTATITWVAAAAGASAQYSQVGTSTGTTSAITTAANFNNAPTAAAPLVAATSLSLANTVGGTSRAYIEVAPFDSNGNALSAEKLTYTISGPGSLGIAAYATSVASTLENITSAGRALTGTAGQYYAAVFADGSAGTATVTVADGTTTLATVAVVFTGSATKVTAVQNLKVLAAGGVVDSTDANATAGDLYNGTYSAGYSSTVLTDGVAAITATTSTHIATPVITVHTTDSLGNPVTLASAANTVIKVVSSNPLVLTAGACTLVTHYATGDTNEINCAVSGTNGALSGQTATATVELYDATTAAWDIVAAPLTFTIGGAITKEVLTTDAASYAPGQPVKLTVTATDKSGNAAYDQDQTLVGTIVSSAYMPSLKSPAYIIGGVNTGTVGYAPASDGSFTISGTDASSLANAVSVTASVTSGAATQASAATDAANEATDAANAATDAANAAADAADAATSAAQDAGAKADAALAAVTALSAKITVLAAQIAKIVKKLKA